MKVSLLCLTSLLCCIELIITQGLRVAIIYIIAVGSAKIHACAGYQYCACSDNDTNDGFDDVATWNLCVGSQDGFVRKFDSNARYYCEVRDPVNYEWNNCEWKQACNNGHPENCWGKFSIWD